MKPTKSQLTKHLNSLSDEKLGNDYAYIMSADLDRSLWWAKSKEFRPMIIERLVNEMLIHWNSKNLENNLKEIGYKSKPKARSTKKQIDQSSINKSKTMTAKKKPSPAQLAARAKFTKMVKEKAVAKKKGLGATAKPKRKKTTSARTLCRKVIDVPGINKRTGQLLKGWHYVNGKPAKVTAKKKPASKAKKPVAKKKVASKRKKFLGIF